VNVLDSAAIRIPKAAVVLGDCLATLRRLPSNFVQCCVTSPPYFGLRDYGVEGQIGLEESPAAYLERLTEVFEEVRRVLRPDGTLWLNLGDSYAANTKGSSGKGAKQCSNAGTLLKGRGWKIPEGLKPKDLIGIPWRAAFALQSAGWWLRQDLIWAKPNPMPEPVRDRCTKSHEYLFMLSKSARYFYDHDAIKEEATGRSAGNGFKRDHRVTIRNGNPEVFGGYERRNKRSVWTVTPKPFRGAHFATFPPELITPCVLAGTKPGDIVLDPFNGAGTTGVVAMAHGRRYLGCELNPEYVEITRARFAEALK
jgi:DNA modification methylase